MSENIERGFMRILIGVLMALHGMAHIVGLYARGKFHRSACRTARSRSSRRSAMTARVSLVYYGWWPRQHSSLRPIR